jgi:hypothetical protein
LLIERYREAQQFADALLEHRRLGHAEVVALVAESVRDFGLGPALMEQLKDGWDQLDPPPVLFEMAE